MNGQETLTILTYCEDLKLAMELVHVANGLKANVVAAVIGPEPGSEANDLATCGANKVLAYQDSSMEYFEVHQLSVLLDAMASKVGADAILIGATQDGNSLVGRLAARLDAGAVTDSIELSIVSNNLHAKRLIYGGAGIANFIMSGSMSVISIQPGAKNSALINSALVNSTMNNSALVNPAPVNCALVDTKQDSTPIIENFIHELEPSPVKLLELKASQANAVSLKDAEVVVAIGRGLKDKEDLKLIEELAIALGGKVGCSRPIAADMEWLPVEQWVGLSGVKIKPRLYLAIGISGQVQHIAGIRDAELVIAINNDADAPIFKCADYGIVGDLYKIVPALLARIKEGA